MPARTPGSHPTRHALFFLLIAASVAPLSCDSGSRSGSFAINAPPDPCSAEAAPQFVGGAPDQVCAGQSFSLNIANARPGFGLESYSVIFRDANDDETQIHGLVVGETTSFDDTLMCDVSRIEVIAPSGVPDGVVEIVVERATGEFFTAGTEEIRGCPEIIGFHAGAPASLTKDPAVDFLPGAGGPSAVGFAMTVYGRNIIRATSASVSDGALFSPYMATPQAVVSGPTTVETAQIDLSPSSPFSMLDLPVGILNPYVSVRVQSSFGGSLVESNPVIVPLRRQFPGGAVFDLPPTISAAFVAPGIHRGDIPIEFVLAATPARATYRIRPEYFDDPTDAWLPCTPTADSELDFIAGSPAETPPLTFLRSGGALHTFTWDSAADFRGAPATVRLRIPLDHLIGVDPNTNTLPTTTIAEQWFELAPVVLSNPVSMDGQVEGFEGSVDEAFVTDYRRDPAGTTAEWTTSNGGALRSTSGETYFGSGLSDLRLLEGMEYEIDTDSTTIFARVAAAGVPFQPLFPLASDPNPGDVLSEFHVRTLEIESGALITVRGENPLVFRVSGTGDFDDIVVDIGAALIPIRSVVTNSFEGIVGGADGGQPAIFRASMTGGRLDVTAPTNGGGGGGLAGTSRVTDEVGGRPIIGGPGGGGGHFAVGDDGEFDVLLPFSALLGQPGDGGPRRGAPFGLRPSGGSGGGGGGAATRLGVDLRGGVGGAGGGAVALFAAGAIEFGGIIDARGHDGRNGPMGLQNIYPGPGGGGSGGHVVFAALGGVELESTATFLVGGGFGGVQSLPGGEVRGGDGSPGRVEFFAEGEFMVETESNEGILPPVSNSDLSIVLGSNAFMNAAIGGPGGPDTVLDLLPTFDMNGDIADSYVFDTDAGELLDPNGAVVHTSSGSTAEFQFDSLMVETDVVVRARGAQSLILRCADTFTLEGTLDVSGDPGGTPTVDGAGDLVRATGGRGGPGGGIGGAGGDDRTPGEVASLAFILASPAGGMDPSTPPDAVSIPGGIVAAFGGQSGSDPTVNTLAAGGGGGGGFREMGGTGATAVATLANGSGGSRYGDTFFSFIDPNTNQVAAVRLGGMGGAGGGGYVETTDPMGVVRPREFGTAGGGGGGFVQIASDGLLTISTTGSVRARGGDAFAARGTGGNGGAGAGGTVFLQSNSEVNFNGTIDLRGGVANQTDGLPYAPNISENGGDGSPGRLRIEAPNGFAVLFGQLSSTAVFSPSVQVANRRISVGRTLPIALSAFDGARLANAWEFDPATFDLPAGSGEDRVVIVHDAAYESASEPGRPGAFFGPFLTPNDIPDGAAFIRPEIYLLPQGNESVRLEGFSIPFRSVDP